MKMDTCYCPFLFIVDVVIINNILLARNKCQHIIIIKAFFCHINVSQNLSAQYQKDIFCASPLNLCLSAYVEEHWLTDTLSIHLFFCVGVQSNTLSRLWFLEGNKNPTQLNLTQEDIKKCFLLSLDSANKTVSSSASILLIQSGLRQQMDHQTLKHMNRLT